MHCRLCLATAALAALTLVPPPARADGPATDKKSPAAEAKPAAAAIAWQTDYGQALTDAKRQSKMLLLFFSDPAEECSRRFEADTLGDAAVATRLKKDFVSARLPRDARVKTEQGEVTLLAHAAFAEMLGGPASPSSISPTPTPRCTATWSACFR